MVVPQHALDLEAGFLIGAPGPVVAQEDVEVDPVDVGGRVEMVEQRFEQLRAQALPRLARRDPLEVELAVRVAELLDEREGGHFA